MKSLLILQIIGAVCVILFGLGNAVRCLIDNSSFILVFLFACIAFVGYRLMLLSSIEELREERNRNNNE